MKLNLEKDFQIRDQIDQNRIISQNSCNVYKESFFLSKIHIFFIQNDTFIAAKFNFNIFVIFSLRMIWL